MESPSTTPLPRVLRYAPLVAAVGALAVTTSSEIIRLSGGPAVPLDDSYIHFQYARSIVELHPFRYTPGAAPTPGATSLLWPLLLAPFYALGLHGERLIWAAWALGWSALAALAVETQKLAEGLVRPAVAIAAATMVVAFGGNAWFAASGMEVVPFAWLLTRAARRAVEWVETEAVASAAARRRGYGELVALAALAPLMRPEGAVASVLIAAALALEPYRGRRTFALAALGGPLLPPAVCRLATGQAVASTAVAKWLPLNPYYRGARVFAPILDNMGTFFGTLLDGRLWTSVFLPQGGRAIAVLALGSIFVAGVLERRVARALAVAALALSALLPTTYETFLVNRLRYIWPFAAGWFIGLATLAQVLGGLLEQGLARLGVDVRGIPLLGAGAAAGLLASRLPPSIDDVAEAAHAVSEQQVSLARWARDALGEGARIGVNDTGAIAYFSGHSTFDVVGLTTAGEARFWTAGAASRFEHYEHLPASLRPTHFVVYPEWFDVDAVLGDELTSRTVHHTILGGATMAAYVARYDLLGSAERPLDIPVDGRALLDTLDVGDLDSEAGHRYALLDATPRTNQVVSGLDRADGARTFRREDRFELVLSPSGVIIARWGAASSVPLELRIDDRTVATPELQGTAWQEITIAVPRDLREGRHVVDVRAVGNQVFGSLHYWSYR